MRFDHVDRQFMHRCEALATQDLRRASCALSLSPRANEKLPPGNGGSAGILTVEPVSW